MQALFPWISTSPAGTLRCTRQSGRPVTRAVMLRQILLNSTNSLDFDLGMDLQTHETVSVNASHGSVNMAALLRPTGSTGGMREHEELNKPDLSTYLVICLVLFLVVLLIVFFIYCQLRNSFFASMPYDRSLREARTSYK